MEEWKPIINYPGYEVSSHGRIRSFWKKNGRHKSVLSVCPNKILKPLNDKHYFFVRLYNEYGVRAITVHRLVLSAFVGPCPDGMEACHNDGNSYNNHLPNLRWDTRSNNARDAIRHGRISKPKHTIHTKLSKKQVIDIRNLYLYGCSAESLAKQYCISLSNIYHVIKRRTWKHI